MIHYTLIALGSLAALIIGCVVVCKYRTGPGHHKAGRRSAAVVWGDTSEHDAAWDLARLTLAVCAAKAGLLTVTLRRPAPRTREETP